MYDLSDWTSEAQNTPGNPPEGRNFVRMICRGCTGGGGVDLFSLLIVKEQPLQRCVAFAVLIETNTRTIESGSSGSQFCGNRQLFQ